MAEVLQPSKDLAQPAVAAAEITPSNSTVYKPCYRGVYVGGTGNLRVRMADGGTVTFTGVPNGAVLPICVDQVLATGTTATSLVGLY